MSQPSGLALPGLEARQRGRAAVIKVMRLFVCHQLLIVLLCFLPMLCGSCS